MIKGLYTAAAGMLSTSISMDTMANNMANMNTVGFKKNHASFQSFPELLIQRTGADGVKQIGSLNSGSKIKATPINFSQGSLRTTGNTFDLAIQGDGFFTVSDDEGNTFYTRNGAFALDANGDLINQEGQKVLAFNNRPINIPRDGQKIEITPTGMITADGEVIDELYITQFKNNATLEKMGGHLFKATDATEFSDAAPVDQTLKYSIFQRTLEGSNVNMVQEMVNNITGLRLYESLQKNIQLQNQTLGKVVNDVGRYR